MATIKVESQWDGTGDMMLNIPHFPHLHSSLNIEANNGTRYPHPYEYFLAAFLGIITLTIKSFSQKNCLLITNLYLSIEGLLNDDKDNLKEITIDIHLNSSSSPEELAQLEKNLVEDNPLFSFLKIDKVHINWN